MSVWAVYRAKSLVLVSFCVGTIGDRHENHVAFIALDVFEILDEQRLWATIHALLIGYGKRLGLQPAIEKFLDQFSLFKVERNHAQRLPRSILHVLQYSVDDHFGFWNVAAFVKYSPPDLVVFDAETRRLMIRRWEDDEITLIKLTVRKRDQTVVSRSIVPAEAANWLIQGADDVQNALTFLDRRPIIVVNSVVVERNALEEASRW